MTEVQIRALTVLGGLTDRRARLTDEIYQAASHARMAGASWAMIGVACGTTTQAAWERFRPPDPSLCKLKQRALPLDLD